MTISEAIGLVDNYRPNLYTPADKVKWLSMIDGMVYRDVIQTHLNFNWRLLPITVSADFEESATIAVYGVMLDHQLDDSWFFLDKEPVHILSNSGNILTLEEPVTVSKWDKLMPAAAVGYRGLPEEVYGTYELLIPDPFAEDVYINYLESRVDKENGEIAKYNVDVSLYNQGYAAYTDHYNRNNLPVHRVKHFKL